MGCVSSRRDINDIHPNIFQVMNVDELGHHVSPGQLELTEVELVLYQRGKAATRWPLRCLRRYGFDEEIFSFESGRRCPTGPGIYAFRCRRAEQLFNLLQQNIQLRNLGDEIVSVANELTIPVVLQTGGPSPTPPPPPPPPPPVSSRQPTEQNYLDATMNRTTAILPRAQNNHRFSRPGSVTSNGPASPPSASSPTPITSESTAASEHNNNNSSNKRLVQHSYSNAHALHEEADGVAQPYMNLEPTSSPTLSSSSEPYAQLNMDSEAECCHVYMNVTPGDGSSATVQKAYESCALLSDSNEDKEDPRHCYANLNPDDAALESTHVNVRLEHKINYIVLDLEQTNRTGDTGAASSASVGAVPESPRRGAKGYATIDFNKTVALSHSVNPCLDLDNEGSRKTRHNSTIGELAPILARHSTSLSD